MSGVPDPSKITPQNIESQMPVEAKTPKEPTKTFLSMEMTDKQISQFLETQIKMMLSDIKRDEKRMIEAMRKIADDDE